MAAAGGRCRLAAEARALHAYSASLGAASAAKYARTGWSRGYMLRRYGVMSEPAPGAAGARLRGGALRRPAAEGPHRRRACGGRLRGWRDGAGLRAPGADGAPLLDISAREALALRRRRRG